MKLGPVPTSVPLASLQMMAGERFTPSLESAEAVRLMGCPVSMRPLLGAPLMVTMGVSGSALCKAPKASSAAPDRSDPNAAERRPPTRIWSISSTGESEELRPNNMAATPAAWGAAIDVPL